MRCVRVTSFHAHIHTHRNETHMVGVILLVSSDNHAEKKERGAGVKSLKTFD